MTETTAVPERAPNWKRAGQIALSAVIAASVVGLAFQISPAIPYMSLLFLMPGCLLALPVILFVWIFPFPLSLTAGTGLKGADFYQMASVFLSVVFWWRATMELVLRSFRKRYPVG